MYTTTGVPAKYEIPLVGVLMFIAGDLSWAFCSIIGLGLCYATIAWLARKNNI